MAAAYPESEPADDHDGVYKQVRGLSGGLQLLRALNKLPGGTGSIGELSRLCGTHRTTIKRLLETLRVEGLVRPGEREGQYSLTFAVKQLSEGFEDDEWIGQIATPRMRASVEELLWPCDLATLDAGFMVVRESTHRWSTLSQHRSMIGERMPVFVTALGRAYLSACSRPELDALLDVLGRRSDWIGERARDTDAVRQLIRETRRRGYAVNEGEWSQQIHYGAIAVPVLAGARLLGALNLIFPKDTVAPRVLKQRFLPRLRSLADGIGKASVQWIER